MISRANLDTQLKQIHFNIHGWGGSEAKELCNVLIQGEEIDECVNGFYEAGFALLVATKDRLLLLDKKPLNYLVVEDLRFDMINEFDYSHRIVGAQVRVSTGMKTLHFTSWNQVRLRRLLSYVQYRMTEIKKMQQLHQEAQKTSLEQMNQQLQMFLTLQHHQLRQQVFGQPAAMNAFGTNNMAALNDGNASQPAHHFSHDQISLSAMKRVVPVISAYTRLPLMSQRRRFYQAT